MANPAHSRRSCRWRGCACRWCGCGCERRRSRLNVFGRTHRRVDEGIRRHTTAAVPIPLGWCSRVGHTKTRNIGEQSCRLSRWRHSTAPSQCGAQDRGGWATFRDPLEVTFFGVGNGWSSVGATVYWYRHTPKSVGTRSGPWAMWEAETRQGWKARPPRHSATATLR